MRGAAVGGAILGTPGVGGWGVGGGGQGDRLYIHTYIHAYTRIYIRIRMCIRMCIRIGEDKEITSTYVCIYTYIHAYTRRDFEGVNKGEHINKRRRSPLLTRGYPCVAPRTKQNLNRT